MSIVTDDNTQIARLLQTIETNITNSETCKNASRSLDKLLKDSSMNFTVSTYHHLAEIRYSIDGSRITEFVRLLVKVIETHITKDDVCGIVSSALWSLFDELSIKCELNQFHPFHSNLFFC